MTIVQQAKAAGFTEVQTAAGWTPLDQWTPYSRQPDNTKSVSFYIDGNQIREHTLSNLSLHHYVTGVWPLR